MGSVPGQPSNRVSYESTGLTCSCKLGYSGVEEGQKEKCDYKSY